MKVLSDKLCQASGTMVGIAVIALVGPVVFGLSGWTNVVKGAAKLLLDAEYGAEGLLIDQLVEATAGALLKASSHPTESERKHAVQTHILKYTQAAHRRARRYARDEADHTARHQRHLAKLKSRISDLTARHDGPTRKTLEHALVHIDRHSGHRTLDRPA